MATPSLTLILSERQRQEREEGGSHQPYGEALSKASQYNGQVEIMVDTARAIVEHENGYRDATVGTEPVNPIIGPRAP